MDKIIIKEAEFDCFVGVTEKEREKSQPILISLIFGKDIQAAGKSDDIKDTINYSEILEYVKEVITVNEYHLIESMAEDLAEKLLDQYPISAVTLIVKKPKAFGNKKVSFAAVEITRVKNA